MQALGEVEASLRMRHVHLVKIQSGPFSHQNPTTVAYYPVFLLMTVVYQWDVRALLRMGFPSFLITNGPR
jgi:hypothetical protein